MYPCVLFALSREARPFCRTFAVRRPVLAPCPAWLCGTAPGVLVLETGVGAERARRALAWLAEEHLRGRPVAVVAAGFAGGLRPQRRVGGVVSAREVGDEQGRAWPTGLFAGADARVLTVGRLVGEPAEKRRLGQAFDADVADMESAALAEDCARRGLPFGCVRAVSDDVDTTLSPRLLGLVEGAGVSATAVLTGVLR